MSMNIFWAAAMVVFIILEAVTAGLASIWFAIGSLFALIAAALDAKLWLQVLIFVIVSIIALIATRPLAMKYVNNKSQPTNADRLIGSTCIVTETIDNIAATGTVSAEGKVWTARSTSGDVIEAQSLVTVDKIEGVKLLVTLNKPAV